MRSQFRLHLQIGIMRKKNFGRKRNKPTNTSTDIREDGPPKTDTDKAVEVEGIVKESLPNAMFKVTLDNDFEVLAHVSGRMRKYFIRILPGDKVRLELSPYDLTRGRITYRYK